jgi:hypothetical protein
MRRKNCFVMSFFRSRTYDFPPEVTVGDTLKILEVQVQSDLGWDAQVQQMVSRATRTIWVIGRISDP